MIIILHKIGIRKRKIQKRKIKKNSQNDNNPPQKNNHPNEVIPHQNSPNEYVIENNISEVLTFEIRMNKNIHERLNGYADEVFIDYIMKISLYEEFYVESIVDLVTLLFIEKNKMLSFDKDFETFIDRLDSNYRRRYRSVLNQQIIFLILISKHRKASSNFIVKHILVKGFVVQIIKFLSV